MKRTRKQREEDTNNGGSCQGRWYHMLQRDELDQSRKSPHHPENLKPMCEDCSAPSSLSET